MWFLIEYKRSEGRIVTLKSFEDSERSEADQFRLEIELDLKEKGIDHEVVLLDASDEQALRRTHRRYFENATQIANSLNSNN